MRLRVTGPVSLQTCLPTRPNAVRLLHRLCRLPCNQDCPWVQTSHRNLQHCGGTVDLPALLRRLGDKATKEFIKTMHRRKKLIEVA